MLIERLIWYYEKKLRNGNLVLARRNALHLRLQKQMLKLTTICSWTKVISTVPIGSPLTKTILLLWRMALQPVGKNYHKIYCTSLTQSKNWNVSRLVLQLSLPKPLKPGVKSRMKMLLLERRQAMLHLHLSNPQSNCTLRGVLYQRFDDNFNPGMDK